MPTYRELFPETVCAVCGGTVIYSAERGIGTVIHEGRVLCTSCFIAALPWNGPVPSVSRSELELRTRPASQS